MRVFGWQTLMRNESENGGIHAPSTGLDFLKDLSKSIYAGTRKMVNYA